jgi:hypothetical protein
MARSSRTWKLRTLLVAVAVLAAMFGGARQELTRPRPIGVDIYGADRPIVRWSDGKLHEDERGRGIYPTVVEFGWMMTRVTWSDGAITRYFHPPGS